MKLRLYFILLFFVLSGTAFSQCFTYTVNACIDYDDHLNISGDSLWWQDYGGSPPNTHGGCVGDVTVNGASWAPWNSVYILPNSTANCTLVATVLQCSNVCDVLQQPTAANGWHGIYDFNDEGPSGSHNYSIQFAFFCPVVTIGPDTTICGGTGANLYANGGVTYSWSPAGSLSCSTCANPVASPATTTTYTVTATNAYNCSETASVTVNVTPIVLTPASTPASCFGGNNGSASITATGGNPALTYAWSNGPVTTNDPNLTAGTYIVTVTDALHCTSTASAIVGQPTQLSATATGTEVTCNGLSNGAINLTPAGGTSPYTYAWNDANTNQNRTNLAAAIYSVTVTDNNLCTVALNDTITQPQVLTANATGTNVSCNGGSDGSVTLAITGGTMQYGYSWNDGNIGQNRTQLPAGTYAVTLTDGNSCTATASATVTQPTQLYVGGTQVNVSCNGGSDGSITTIDTGGTAPYGWLWNDGNTNQNRSNLVAGNYSVTSTDIHLCTVTLSFTITQPAAIVVTQTYVNDSCFSAADGSVNLSITGGISPFTFAWNDGNTNQNRTNLAAANYTVTVTDSDACTTSLSINITQPAALVVNAVPTPVTCFGGNDGKVADTNSGGTTPYTYVWSNGAATQNLNQVVAGTYVITVTDALLCTATTSAIVTQPDSISFAETVTNPLCPEVDHNGSIVLTITGGVGPYSYEWADGSTQSSLTQLTIGNYAVTVTDANGCTADNNFALLYRFNFSIVMTPTTTLMLGQNETLGFTITGNAGTYTNIWTPDIGLSCTTCSSPVASPVRTTLYNIAIQNDSGCYASDTVTVYVIPQYNIFIPNVFTPGKNGNNNYFSIYGNTQQLQYLHVAIFDRVGEKVFESNDINFAWDGTYKGVLMPAGVYVYELRLVFTDDHTDNLKSGSITLLR